MGRDREQGRGSPEGLAADLPALDFIHSGAGPCGIAGFSSVLAGGAILWVGGRVQIAPEGL